MITTKTRTGSKLKRTTIFLTEDDHEALRHIAFTKRTSMARLIREAVLEIIEEDEDVREAMKAEQEGEEGSITLKEYTRLRAEGKE